MSAIVHTSIILDTRRVLKDGSYPVKLRLTHARQRKYFLTPYNLTEEDFAKVKSDKPRGKFKELEITFQAIEQRAIDILKKLEVFTFDAFEKKFYNVASKQDVLSSIREKVAALKKEGRPGTAETYASTLTSLAAYTKKKVLPFSVVNPEFLREYEQWMVGRGKSITTVGIYLRSLRSIFNDAIASGEVSQALYPFGKRKYLIPAGRNVKKALATTDIEKLFAYIPKHDAEARARDLWIFSYLCNGINIKDIARLKYKQLEPDRITFIRAKTERTSRQNIKVITAMRTPEVDQIIDKWGNKPAYSENYVFPLLKPGLNPEQELATVRQATAIINRYIKLIAAAVGIDKNITTYTARHSFSTVLKRSGAPIEFISESLGHSDLKTTQSYLDSFEDKIKKQYSSQLTAFLREAK
ncbi:site-specific integrase [Adhaeribacter radiodurans]|uniref:Site-specific integrase n=1 Tax=Adhaeribacter radiodurans TaxID=2745197 RepID=A0A7L7LDC7_9BACT|nr:site-specific integrase [Adhaeribacter radiodurans]QMU30535.1 site-specific integrase [Adhaeribacter radiodurans]